MAMSASTQNGVAGGAPHGCGKNVAGTTIQNVGYVDQVAPGKGGLHGKARPPQGRPHYAAGPCPQGLRYSAERHSSEKSGAQIQAVGGEQEEDEQGDAAKHGNGLERFDIDPDTGCAGENSGNSSHLRPPKLDLEARSVGAVGYRRPRAANVSLITAGHPTSRGRSTRQARGGSQFEFFATLLCWKCSTAPSIRTQLCFDCSKTDLTGAGHFGSASAPTATPISDGRLSA